LNEVGHAWARKSPTALPGFGHLLTVSDLACRFAAAIIVISAGRDDPSTTKGREGAPPSPENGANAFWLNLHNLPPVAGLR
jgi:hypothetical protein